MAKSKNRIQYLLNDYLERNGTIDLLLPDGVELEIGITQEGKRGAEKLADYCWVATTREDRATVIDRYAMSMEFDDGACLVDEGMVTII